jgi:pyruvate formate lyase activating enzyme
MSNITGLIFDIKRFAVHDGPGIRTTVFLKGCPLSCWWCHNPEGLKNKQEIIFYEYKCISCNKCIDICSKNALKKINNKLNRNYKICLSCGNCAEICPTASQQIIGRRLTPEKIIEEIEKDRLFFESSSGGVTFSGGEPLMQHTFIKETLKLCKKRGIHTALDTSGYSSTNAFNKTMKYTDLYLYDLKIFDDQKHERYTGVSNKSILKNLETLNKNKKEIILRFTIINDVTNTKENLNDITNFISSLKRINEINLLPFHDVSEKYQRLGKEYKLKNIQPPSENEIEKIVELFEHRGLNVKIGG